MYKLKLFEDFEEEKPFVTIDDQDEFIDNAVFIHIDDYFLGGERFIKMLKNKLGDSFTIVRKEDTIFICSTLKPFLWKVLFMEDDYFLVKRSFLLQNVGSTEMFFKCDGIKGIVNLIDPTYDFHTLYKQSDIRIWYENASVKDSIKGSNWIDMPRFLSPTLNKSKDIESLNYSLNKESYPMNDVQDMLNTLKKEIKLKVSKATLYEIPEDVRTMGIDESGYEIFKITSDDYDKFVIFYYYIKAFNMFCVLSIHFDRYVKTYTCWDIKGLKSLLSYI